jgi:hypothetical protein
MVEGRIIFFQPGFWVMIAGAIILAYGFLGLAFSRLGHELPANNADESAEREEQPGESEAPLPNPFSTDADRGGENKDAS